VFATMALAEDGIEQFPLAPRTTNVADSVPPIGVERWLTLVPPALVSTSRHGTIGTSAEGALLPAGLADGTSPTALTVASTMAAAMPRWTT
jgi:hypothetical protein